MAKFLLIGKLLTKKSFIKEAFKRIMIAIWQPKARVQIGDLDDQCFVFSFNFKEERAMICMGGPWTFNQSLLVMAEADVCEPSTYPTQYARVLGADSRSPVGAYDSGHGQRNGMAMG
ncbi:hypothetical protein Pyn_12878 [Prunus yedoensis var. nudiflora]|uniref:DUF4283 domain-containing protein n=1 Tax=Prunus yedoensis var. nudiflora TaxID=2094558 RepID=A0A314XEZ6_PRUYE|nr:hypothetical protein Pyn_12878 [Prunus yedoensis var. nudiflora]